jgi:hypothetical protein
VRQPSDDVDSVSTSAWVWAVNCAQAQFTLFLPTAPRHSSGPADTVDVNRAVDDAGIASRT